MSAKITKSGLQATAMIGDAGSSPAPGTRLSRSDASLPPTGTEATKKLRMGGSNTKFLENMEIVFYIIIAAIVLAIGWIVWAVVEEGRPELPNKEDEK